MNRTTKYLLCLVAVLCSCSEFCEESVQTAVVVAFYDSLSEAEISQTVTVKGVDNDSLLYNQQALKAVLLPIDMSADSVAYVFTVGGEADTVTIVYDRHAGFVSSECGCAGFADIRAVPRSTNHALRSIRLVDPAVGTVSYRNGVIYAENIRIYY